MMIPLSFFFLYSFVSKKLADFGLRKVHLWVLQITGIHKKLATLIVPWHPTCRELWESSYQNLQTGPGTALKADTT
jgi:hypothetical protein